MSARGSAPAAALGLLPDVPRFFFIRESRGGVCHSSAEVVALVGDEAQADREWFQVLYLDPKNQVIEKRLESSGTTDSAAIYPREIMRSALLCGASALICVHNHPSGDPEPSLANREVTRDIVFAGRVMGLKVLDHVIIGARVDGQRRHFSFGDSGLINDYDLAFNGFPR